MSDVSRETWDRLSILEDLIRRWNPRINLVAPSTIPALHTRHIEDCLQVAQLADPKQGSWVDLGSGGGLPGLVLASAYQDRPLTVTLIESDQRKCAFLRTAIRELGLTKTMVLNTRIEQADLQNATYISARALAPLPRLMPYLKRHLAQDGQAWLMKGVQWRDELEEARGEWDFQVESFPSHTQSGAAIIKISGVTHD